MGPDDRARIYLSSNQTLLHVRFFSLIIVKLYHLISCHMVNTKMVHIYVIIHNNLNIALSFSDRIIYDADVVE